jgi:hypothetical protein
MRRIYECTRFKLEGDDVIYQRVSNVIRVSNTTLVVLVKHCVSNELLQMDANAFVSIDLTNERSVN